MVFDHTGKLMREHMCGAYHDGDGNQFAEWVDALVAQAPSIFLGAQPFRHTADLAKQVQSGKNLKGSLAKLKAKRAGKQLDEDGNVRYFTGDVLRVIAA